ncbi:azurocidin isoform X2 [Amyelois transitella]|uniref:azurocidin isoform X2 n=1 Tax=Amyelois transitella TaxID=680683 RepID=UPI00067B612E|nr:azurocidin isoform X2 [Amyelois transitella]
MRALYFASNPSEEPPIPFIAFLTSPGGGVVCSAAIVHESFVLTAATCFVGNTGEMISFQHKILVDNSYRAISQLLPHPSYRLLTNYYDAGLIRLKDKIIFSPAVGRVELARTEMMEVGDEMKTACWMMDNERSWLQAAPAYIVMKSLCGSTPLVGLFTAPVVVCASARDECFVDIGSPLYESNLLYGIATRRRNNKSLFTKVNNIRGWIVNVLYQGHMKDYFEDKFS